MNDYEAKQEAKRARLSKAADRCAEEAERRLRTATEMVGVMNGQPILVGHHSEKRHRRDIRRADDNFRKASEAHAEAKDLRHRAAAVGTGGISSDDPDAADKLSEKVETLEAAREMMKRINVYYRQRGTLDGAEDAGLDARLLASGRRTLIQPYNKQPFPGWALTNIGARIRQARARILEVEQVAERRDEDPTTENFGGGAAAVTQDPGENRVCLSFTRRLSRDEYKRVRSFGFVWSRTRNAFVRKLSPGAVEMARTLARQLVPS